MGSNNNLRPRLVLFGLEVHQERQEIEILSWLERHHHQPAGKVMLKGQQINQQNHSSLSSHSSSKVNGRSENRGDLSAVVVVVVLVDLVFQLGEPHRARNGIFYRMDINRMNERSYIVLFCISGAFGWLVILLYHGRIDIWHRTCNDPTPQMADTILSCTYRFVCPLLGEVFVEQVQIWLAIVLREQKISVGRNQRQLFLYLPVREYRSSRQKSVKLLWSTQCYLKCLLIKNFKKIPVIS